MDESCNLTKFLAQTGIASRRRCVDLIKYGAVTVNGVGETNPGRRVADSDEVVCEGKVVRRHTDHLYLMLNKPRGYVCTNDDPHAEKKAIDLIQTPEGRRLFYAGRLDKGSEGLILYSDDGDFVARLTHPRYEVYKTYFVSVERPLSDRDRRQFCAGVRDGGELLKARAVLPLGDNKYHFVLSEGKNREIRRLLESVGNRARRLIRIAVGRLPLGDLPTGEWRELNPEECRLAFEVPENFSGPVSFPAP